VCSRRQAERLVAAGMVKVEGRTVFENVGVTEETKVSIQRRQDSNTREVPMRNDTKLWVFYKPCKMITTHDDPKKRLTVFDFLKSKGFPAEHIISVGRLDFNSEGLLILTNNGDLAQALERPENGVEREYRVRAWGKWTDEDLEAMKKGVTVKGKLYKPMAIWCQRRQTTNTWFRTVLTEGKNREVRRILEHFDLRVNRLIRVRYGSLTLGGLEPGEFREERVSVELQELLLKSLKARA
jgi:23S rRNA pseudouridine2605 synthase